MENVVFRDKPQGEHQQAGDRHPGAHGECNALHPYRPSRLCGILDGYEKQTDDAQTGEIHVVHPQGGVQALDPIFGFVVLATTFVMTFGSCGMLFSGSYHVCGFHGCVMTTMTTAMLCSLSRCRVFRKEQAEH